MKVIKWYSDVTVIVNGALDQEHRFYDPSDCDVFFDETVTELEKLHSKNEIDDGQIYIIEHNHMPRDCSCVQYLTDHHPDFTTTEEG